MRIAIGADHAGYTMKSQLTELLKSLGHEVVDVGAHTPDPSDDYPDFAKALAERVATQQADRFISVVVEDNGPGIDPENLGAIYEPYHTTKADGTGLGMMIVQRIMRDHGGEIEINSEPGRGTRLTLRFPREDARLNLLEAPKQTAPPQ